MRNRLTKFLKEYAARQGLKVPTEASGEIVITQFQRSIKQSTGAVYGLIVELSGSDIEAASEEIQVDGKAPIFENWYALYWGKDSNPGARIRAHVQNHQGTGNAKLEKYRFLHGKPIIYSMIWVEKYEQFEKSLHAEFSPLLGSRRPGSLSKIVTIEL